MQFCAILRRETGDIRIEIHIFFACGARFGQTNRFLIEMLTIKLNSVIEERPIVSPNINAGTTCTM